jgi:hypothetical protein
LFLKSILLPLHDMKINKITNNIINSSHLK